MIEYRKLERDGHCSLCGKEVKANQDEVRRIHCYFRSKSPIINICDECAYKIFYAPAFVKGEDVLMAEDEGDTIYDINQN